MNPSVRTASTPVACTPSFTDAVMVSRFYVCTESDSPSDDFRKPS